jgi:hypothetical protein
MPIASMDEEIERGSKSIIVMKSLTTRSLISTNSTMRSTTTLKMTIVLSKCQKLKRRFVFESQSAKRKGKGKFVLVKI